MTLERKPAKPANETF